MVPSGRWVGKQVDPVAETAGLGDRFSIAYSGSIVASGRGVGVVTATGADTEIGRISAMIDEVEDLATPLEQQIRRFSSLLSKVILAVAVFMLAFGRGVHDLVVFLLPTNGAQSLVLLTAVLLGLPLPLEPAQILWVNLIAAVTLPLALAFEPAEPDVMRRPPRIRGSAIIEHRAVAKILLASLLIGGATLAVYFLARAQGIGEAQRQTLAVTMLAMGQVGYLFNCRNLRGSSLRWSLPFTNRIAWLSVAALLLLQGLFVHAPIMHTLFGSAPLPASGWGITLAPDHRPRPSPPSRRIPCPPPITSTPAASRRPAATAPAGWGAPSACWSTSTGAWSGGSAARACH